MPPIDANSEVAGSLSAFDLLHPGVQRQLWNMQWTQLRPLQAQAIRELMGSSADLILSAGTASGKTEAAFLPVLSKIADLPPGSVRALYVGPLKALINDQFSRIGDLCGHLEVPVHHWHGDVSATHKAQLIKAPGGVLLITPESLESLFVNRSEYVVKLFGGLRFVVIDELHSFLDNERGLHLRSLLYRLAAVVRELEPFRFIALSATIGDPSLAKRFLRPNDPELVRMIAEDSDHKELKLRIYGYRSVPTNDDQRPAHVEQMAADLVKHCHGAANLIFANAKAQVEELADVCQGLGKKQGLADRFLVHHGSLSAEIRQDAEATLKSGTMATAFCSSTLEMGIDIGSVKMVGQVGPPWSVASLKQRAGRGGRRDGEARILRMYIACENPGPESNLFDRLHLDLIQAIAVTELMLSGWVEPPSPPVCDLSTLTQQIISVIAQTGGIRADQLYQRLCAEGAFGDVEQPLFLRLLRQLASTDVLEQMPEGDLILGLVGERLRKDKGFYAVFPTPEEFVVLHGAERVGTVSAAVEPGEHLLLAGRRWQVTLVDQERLELYVKPARGWKAPKFSGGTGVIHARIREKMREVLGGVLPFVYLDPNADRLLSEARRTAAAAAACTAKVIPLGPRKTALMTWTGNRTHDTLRLLFAASNTEPGDEQIALVFDLPSDQVIRAARQIASREYTSVGAAKLSGRGLGRKYDWLLDRELLAISVARGWIDVNGAIGSVVDL